MRSLDEIAAEINALTGVTDDSPRQLAWRIICNSQRDCSCCGKCGKAIAAGERVCRTRISRQGFFGGASHSLVALCQKCAEQDWHWKYRKLVLKPCEGCSREIWTEAQLRWSDDAGGYLAIPVTCCEDCSHKVRVAAARRRRTARRGTRECLICSETFEPTGADAKFCSVACKQRATDTALRMMRRCYATTGRENRRAKRRAHNVKPREV